jgi:hypothetical protein
MADKKLSNIRRKKIAKSRTNLDEHWEKVGGEHDPFATNLVLWCQLLDQIWSLSNLFSDHFLQNVLLKTSRKPALGKPDLCIELAHAEGEDVQQLHGARNVAENRL